MTWTLDQAHSKIGFMARHMMISKVRGEFQTFDVDLAFDPENLNDTTIGVTIDAASIYTKQTDRDNHLKSADFLNAEEFPKITFKSTEFKKTEDENVELVGELTIKGITKPVTLTGVQEGPVQNPFTNATTIGYTLSATINREDWGLTWNQAMEAGGVLVGKTITLNIEAEIAKSA